MNLNRWKIASLLCAWTLAFFGAATAAGAQAPAPTALIHSLDTSQFPSVTFKLDLTDGADFIPDLQASDLTVIEDKQEIPVQNLTVSRAKAQIVIALNPAMVMVNQYQKSNMLQKLQANLTAWAKTQPAAGQDDYNLALNDGMLALHLSQPADFINVVNAYQPNLYTVQTNLNSLNTALEMATDPNIPADVKKEILYISPAPAPTFLTTVPALIERVRKAGVRVDVWLISASPAVTARGAEGLKQLAEATGGEYFIFSGREELPNLDDYLDKVRGQYQVTYASGIKSGGEHSLSLRVSGPAGEVESSPLVFPFDVQPPNPILLNPPAAITLPVVEVKSGGAIQPAIEQEIQAVIEFPDGHPRPLKSSQLYVDGTLAVENTAPPFDAFIWRIPEDAAQKRHLLQVKAEDVLGLSRTSAASPVEVLENPASRTLLEQIASSERLLAASAIAAAVLGILILVWLTSRRSRFHAAPARTAAFDSPTRPLHPADVPPARPAAPTPASAQAPTVPLKFRPAPSPAAPRTAPAHPAPRPAVIPPTETNAAKRPVSFSKPARLTRLDQANKPVSGGEFLLTRAEVTIGSSPGKSILVIDLPSVDALHARLVRTIDDTYFLADCGSVGGTWVNFAPVSSRGVHLVDGDLIHFGRTPFRFELARPDDPLIKPGGSGENRQK